MRSYDRVPAQKVTGSSSSQNSRSEVHGHIGDSHQVRHGSLRNIPREHREPAPFPAASVVFDWKTYKDTSSNACRYYDSLQMSARKGYSTEWTMDTVNLKGDEVKLPLVIKELSHNTEGVTLQTTLRCRNHEDTWSRPDLLPYWFEVLKGQPHVCTDDEWKLSERASVQLHEWQKSALSTSLKQSLESNWSFFKNVENIFCFGRGFGCFGEHMPGDMPKNQPHALSFILGSVFRVCERKANRARKPTIFMVGSRYCGVCKYILFDNLDACCPPSRNEQSDRLLPERARKLDTVRLNASEDDVFRNLSPKSVIICCETDIPVYQIVADIARTRYQGGVEVAPAAVLDGGTRNPSEEASLRDNPFEKRVADFFSSKYQSIHLAGAQSSEATATWEGSVFPNTKWTLYMRGGRRNGIQGRFFDLDG